MTLPADNVPELAQPGLTQKERWLAVWHHWRREVGFAVFLYPFVFAGTLHVILTPSAEKMRVADYQTVIGYTTWEVCGILAAVLFFGQWLLRIYGHSYLGLTMRMVANILLATVIWAVWVARVNADFKFKDVNIFTNYIFVSVGVFVLAMIGRDVWVLFFRRGP